ncbi:S1 family peptidase [Streptomyces sp. MAR4 CNX-425]|uniref:S1 family peptidase n=1 Tax=Streptomyces sp. MAR4 CNX-425 TaxID=3406343 RepID=UPI003B5116E8
MARSLTGLRRWATVLVAPALLAAATTGASAAPPAGDAPDPAPGAVEVAAGISATRAQDLAGALGEDRTGGFYLDRESRRMVVTVTDDAAAERVRAAGGVARHVAYSAAELRDVTTALNQNPDARVTSTAWGTNPVTNRVEVEAGDAVSDAEFAGLKEIAAGFGDAVTLRRVDGDVTTDATVLQGGKYIAAHNLSCSGAFNVREKSDNSSKYLLTAGHCTKGATGVADWYNANGVYFGYDAGGYFPTHDWGIIKHYNASVSKPGTIWLHQYQKERDVTYSRDPVAGESVQRSGYRTGLRNGRVIQLNVTVNYPEGPLYNMFSYSACSNSGDSGGAIVHETAAIAIHSGRRDGSDCHAYGQPVNPALAWYGVEVY